MFGGLFGKKKKTPEQLVQAIREALTAFDPSSESKDQEKVSDAATPHNRQVECVRPDFVALVR